MMAELTSTSVDMTNEQLTALHRACTIIEEITAGKCKEIMSMAGESPCIQIFMSDGWSTDIRSRFCSSSGGVDVRRTGRLRTEFVVQRMIVKAMVNGQMEIGMKIERPRPLAAKKCNDIFSAACDHCALPKLFGHKGISISVYLQDGLFARPFGRRMQARHNLFLKPELCPVTFASGADRELCELRDWVLIWCCCAHSCSRALKWGLKSLVVDSEMLESVHICISALLRASTGLHQSVPLFILNSVAYDRPPPTDPEQIEHLWSFLEVAPNHLDLFVSVNPFWDGRVLHVSAALLTQPDPVGAVTTILRYCLKWVDFSETRWTKVGEAGRMYLRSLLVGVDGLVKLTEQNDAVCRWHLAGYFKRCSKSVRVYLAVAAAAGRPSESMLFDMMQDDRFLQRSDHCKQILSDELQYILTLPDLFFTTVAEAVNLSFIEYRSHCIAASMVSIAYLHLDIWLPLSRPPWKDFLGDTKKNLESLKVDDTVTEPTSVKMRSLLRLGFDEDVDAGCKLVQETSMTTTLVEQFHGSGAQIMHRHAQLEHEALVARMTVHHSRTLFSPCLFDKTEARLHSLLDTISQQMQNTKYSGARQAYTKLLMSQVKVSHIPGDPSHHALRRSVFKHHSKGFARLSPQDVALLRHRASAHNTAKLTTLSESRDHVLGQLELVRLRRLDAANKQGIVNHMDSARFGHEEYTKFSELWTYYRFRSSMATLQDPLSPVPTAMVNFLEGEMDQLYVEPRVRLDWLSTVLSFREEFANVGFYSDSHNRDASVIYKLMLAIGQAQRVVFLECHRCKAWDRGFSYRNYQYDCLNLVDEGHVPFLSKEDIMVVPEMNFREMNVHVIGFPMPFIQFAMYLRQPTSEPTCGPTRTRSRSSTDPELLGLLQQEFPWLSLDEIQRLLGSRAEKQGGGQSGGAQSSSGSGSGSGSVAEPIEIPENVLAAVSDELQGLKEQYHGFDEEGTFFTVRVLGGDWSISKRGVPCTDVGAYAIDKSTQRWCTGVGWPAAKSFAVRKHEGVENARHLAEEMCRRGNFFVKSWCDAGSPSGYRFEDIKASYVAPPSYFDWLDTLAISSKACQAAFEIRELCPLPVPE